MEFTHATSDRQIHYSPGRNALGEYVKIGKRWVFDGWLYEGKVMNLAQAHALTDEYLEIFGYRG